MGCLIETGEKFSKGLLSRSTQEKGKRGEELLKQT